MEACIRLTTTDHSKGPLRRPLFLEEGQMSLPEPIVIIAAIGVAIAATRSHFKHKRSHLNQVQTIENEGAMIKAIKITMGICIGLFLMYLLFMAGILGIAGVAFFNH